MATIDKIVFSQNTPAKNTLWARPSEKGTELLIFNKGKWGTVGADDFQRFHYEVYSSLEDITEPKPNALYLIGPKGEGEDKYDEYVYTEEGFTKIGDTSIDMSGKEDVTTIVAPVNTTDATLPITTLTTEIGKYYRIDVPIETLGVTLPAMTDLTTVRTVVLYLTGGTTPAITISSTAVSGGTAPAVYYQDRFKIEAGKTYEVNALFNGSAWVIASVEIFVPEPEPITIVYKGDNASATNIMTKTINAFGDTYTLDEASITKMTLDDNKVTLTDFNIANLCQYGETCDVYTYTFNDANEHTLKVWTNSSDMFRLSPWSGGPSPSQSAHFSSIKSVVIPNTITTIGAKAFRYCSGLTSIEIPDSVTSIGDNAFSSCTSLTSVTIGSGVTSIGNMAFYFCTGLTSVTIPDSVTSIGGSAFYQCSRLTSVTIPDSVTSIGNNVFQQCSDLTSVTIGSGVTRISDYAFYQCTGLTSIDIPSSVTSIGNFAFENCSGLTSIDIPSGVTSIGQYAFNGCSGLPVENNIRYADTYAVEAVDKSLTTYTIKEGTKWIGSKAFYQCTGLTSIDIPSSVTSIGGSAFAYCSSLTSIDIPSSVTSIGSNVFLSCGNLFTITSHIMNAPSVDNGTFEDVKTGGTLYVPIGSSGYETWMNNQGNLGMYNWTKVEQ